MRKCRARRVRTRFRRVHVVRGCHILWSIAEGDCRPRVNEELILCEADGIALPVRAWGDEFHRVIETLSGFTLTPDPQTGWAIVPGRLRRPIAPRATPVGPGRCGEVKILHRCQALRPPSA